MGRHDDTVSPPGMGKSGLSSLGGAACGLSYEGAVHDALARYEVAWKREVARQRRLAGPVAASAAPRQDSADK